MGARRQRCRGRKGSARLIMRKSGIGRSGEDEAVVDGLARREALQADGDIAFEAEADAAELPAEAE